jgi:hypothetical protein
MISDDRPWHHQRRAADLTEPRSGRERLPIRYAALEHDGAYLIKAEVVELMSTRRHLSEDRLAQVACEPLRDVALPVAALRPPGVIAYWSVGDDPRFLDALQRAKLRSRPAADGAIRGPYASQAPRISYDAPAHQRASMPSRRRRCG